MKKKIIIPLFILVLAGAVLSTLRYVKQSGFQPIIFKTAQVSRGNVVITISATGTVEPEEVIDVGAQVAGRIVSFGRDSNGKTVDYGSVVEEGLVLASIDDSLYAAEVAGAEAAVRSAKANSKHSEADLKVMEAKLYQAERDWQRAQKLGPSEALAQSIFDSYKSAYETARANIAVSKAAILQANAGVDKAEATLQRAQRNLGYCTITSPVKGVIIDRRVNIGQTVVASLNAPSLFLLAKDLKRMQVWVAVNEADIGRIKSGQPVNFTVDALPGESFKGEVSKVRLNASMTQNVVMYTVEVVTNNDDGRLLPYLTANVHFEINRQDDVMLVPNSSLRFKPASELIDPLFTHYNSRSNSTDPATLWVQHEEYLRPVKVETGLSDGIKTEVSGVELTEGMNIVNGLQAQPQARRKKKRETNNPFMTNLPPKRGGGNREK